MDDPSNSTVAEVDDHNDWSYNLKNIDLISDMIRDTPEYFQGLNIKTANS